MIHLRRTPHILQRLSSLLVPVQIILHRHPVLEQRWLVGYTGVPCVDPVVIVLQTRSQAVDVGRRRAARVQALLVVEDFEQDSVGGLHCSIGVEVVQRREDEATKQINTPIYTKENLRTHLDIAIFVFVFGESSACGR
jgi:hypothetical protein